MSWYPGLHLPSCSLDSDGGTPSFPLAGACMEIISSISNPHPVLATENRGELILSSQQL
jgi:hypothetical protein